MRSVIGILLIAFGLTVAPAMAQPTYDVLIENGRVLDGTGTPWRRA